MTGLYDAYEDCVAQSPGELLAALDERQLTLERLYPNVADMRAMQELSAQRARYRSPVTHLEPVDGERWPEELISWRAICVQAEYLFGLIQLYRDQHKEALDAPETRALTHYAYNLFVACEATAQPHLDAWREARDTARQEARGTMIRVMHPELDGEWVEATIHLVQTADIIAAFRAKDQRGVNAGLRRVDWSSIHPADRARLEVAR